MFLCRTLIKKGFSPIILRTPFFSPTEVYSTYGRNCNSFFRGNRPPIVGVLFVFPLPPVVTDGRIDRCSFKKKKS